jgi:WXG100 family type VII secretion target
MSEYTRASFGGLAQGQADFASIYGQLTSTVQDLDSRLRANLAEWDGSAQQAYYTAKQAWDSAMADMGNVLNQLGAVIGVAHENYTHAEAANSALWGS